MQFRLMFLTAVLSHFVPVLSAPPIIVGYYPMWKHEILSKLDLANYTHVNFAFAIPDENAKLAFDGEASMPEIIAKLQGHNTKALVSLGGWTGSVHFSNIVKKPELSEALTNNIIQMMKTHNLDGIDIDWEYPGQEGNPCNFVDTEKDTANFLIYLKSLRAKMDEALGKDKLITLAVRLQPFAGASGADISEFAKVVNFANLMQYDINGAWGKTTGPNAPLNFEKDKATQLSFATAIEEWTKAGWPATQLTGGLAFYGRSMTATENMLAANPVSQYQNFSKEIPKGDKTDELTAEVCPPNAAKPINETTTKVFSGTWMYSNLREQGVLTAPTTPSSCWVRTVDNITATPWLFNAQTKVFISYDDPESLKAKVDFATSKGLGGVMVWEISGDFNGELASAIRA